MRPPPAAGDSHHRPTPLQCVTARQTTATSKAHTANDADQVVFCTDCRLSTLEKVSVVPLDAGAQRSSRSTSSPSPTHTGILKSLFSSLAWRSPRLSSSCSSTSATPSRAPPLPEAEWRHMAVELSRELIRATRRRDESLSEASRLKYSASELENKLSRLENYCSELKSALDRCSRGHHRPMAPLGSREFPLEPFLRAVSDARSAVRQLSRALAAETRQAGKPPKAHDDTPRPDVRSFATAGGNNLPGGLVFYVEALLSRAFYEDFESSVFRGGSSDRFLDPRARAEANFASYVTLRGVTWEDVLRRGTRHYSEAFSRFCDRKMGEVAATGGGAWWGRRGGAGPEPMLRAFFGAAKGVWLVHLLAWCGHPPVSVFRVDKGAPFDAGYMEDAAPGGRGKRQPAAATVRVMVAPGFYLQGGVVKCKVLCVYGKANSDSKDSNDVRRTKTNGNRDCGDESIIKSHSQERL